MRRTACVALVCLTAAAPRGDRSAGAKRSPFVAVVARNWAAWDTNQDGTLSAEEIDRAVLDPTVRGDDAAAAAALKSVVRSKKMIAPPLTRDYFEQVDSRATAPPGSDEDAARATVDLDKSAGTTPKWDQLFAGNRHRIRVADAATAQWPTADVLLHMHQGPLGDCFLIAPLGAALNRDPSVLHRMLSPAGGGGVRVTFAAAPAAPVTVALTDAERALSSSTGGQGDWLAMLEEAYGRYLRRRKAGDGPEPIEGTDVICNGGTPGPVLTAVTGHGCNTVSLPHDAAKRRAEADHLLPTLRTAIATALRDRRLITTGVGADPNKPKPGGPARQPDAADAEDPSTGVASVTLPSPPNITHGHCYAVVGYDASRDVVLIWNPHGQTFHPQGVPGLANGYETDHGLFKVPLPEMYQFASGVCYETNQPATPESPARGKTK